MNEELLRRAEDLCARCERTCSVTATAFLTPAEQYSLSAWAKRKQGCTCVLLGGGEACERKAAFFLPFYLAPEDFDVSEYIRAVKITPAFGEPGHRDYLGALLALGVRREWLGDIVVTGGNAYVFCLKSIETALLGLERVGRCGVKVSSVPLSEVPAPERRVKAVTFTVQSARFDAALAGLFGLSRTAAAEKIRAGLASRNYSECPRPDAPVREGDILSLRGEGKGEIKTVGGESRKGRVFVTAELWK